MCRLYPNLTEYLFRISLPRSTDFLTAVLLTSRAIAASVKLAYSVVTDVSRSFTETVTPLRAIAALENLTRVILESLIPSLRSDNFLRSSGDRILPEAALDKFSLVESLTFRSFLKNSNVSVLCLKPKREPALFKILYSGFNKSKKYCSLSTGLTPSTQYSNISSLKF